jgi:hypothetical protein
MASRKEEKERRRQERLAAERAAAEQAQRRRTYGIFVGGVLVVAAIVAVVVIIVAGGGTSGTDQPAGSYSVKAKNTLTPPPAKITDLFQAAKAAGCELKNPPIEGRQHVTTKVKYGTNPPTSGNHNPTPALDGVYTTEPNPTNFVHTMEHGRVEFEYSPSLSKKRIRQLGGLFNEDPHILLLFPNDTMPYKMAAAAWGHLIGCKNVTDATFDALRTFRDRYRDKGPEPSSIQPANF